MCTQKAKTITFNEALQQDLEWLSRKIFEKTVLKFLVFFSVNAIELFDCYLRGNNVFISWFLLYKSPIWNVKVCGHSTYSLCEFRRLFTCVYYCTLFLYWTSFRKLVLIMLNITWNMQARHNFQRISLDFIAQKEVKTTLIMGNYRALGNNNCQKVQICNLIV